MSDDPLNALLAKLCAGDASAAEQAFVAYEPFLRMVVRRQLPDRMRAKFDSEDIVLSVWADLLKGFRGAAWQFRDVNHLRAFLIKVTRNRFIDRLRRHQPALQREQPLPEDDGAGDLPGLPQPRPSEVVQAAELWDQLLALCPPAHRELLELKRQGLPLKEIAARTGLHASSVRRILYELAGNWQAQEQLPPTLDPERGHVPFPG
jgi:RNA polymerase sigma factor (sigma-70 family)